MSEATTPELPDKLVVRGLSKTLDGEYPCDLTGMMIVGHPETLSNRELRRVKLMTGVRAGELDDALVAGDNDVLVALAAVVLTRAGKNVDEDVLWDAPSGSKIEWEVGDRDDSDDEESDLPPLHDGSPPRSDDESSTTSGASSTTPSENDQPAPSPTGDRSSDSSE